jgi:hypothetical protein
MSEQILNKEDRFGRLAVEYLIEKRLREKYAAKLSDQHKVVRTPVKTSYIRYVIKIAAVFLGTLVSVFVIHFYLNNSIQIIVKNHIQNTNILGNQSIMRKDVSYENSTRIKANAAFVLKEYEDALFYYTSLAERSLALPIDYFYLGVCHLRSKKINPSAAITSLNIAKQEEGIIEETEWFLALAFLINKDEKNAEKILENIILRDNYKSKEAIELLSLIKKKH